MAHQDPGALNQRGTETVVQEALEGSPQKSVGLYLLNECYRVRHCSKL